MRRSRKTDAAGGFATLALLLIVSLSTGPAVGADPAHDGPEQSSQSGEWKLLHLQAAPSGYTTNLLFDPVSS
ncbi:MAG TPA: hypothetical protein VI893_01570, partial [Thermoplasmata archaeon]|nr:hypothetical protein [Thermoplasmata archaeon]